MFYTKRRDVFKSLSKALLEDSKREYKFWTQLFSTVANSCSFITNFSSFTSITFGTIM
jgi:hypothetical protein